jgi:dTDP-4-dehydrorhamnose 3,5-epimerase
MNIHPTSLKEVLLLEPDVFRDERGFFMESFSEKKLNSLGIEFRGVQDNHCLSEKVGTLRGLHYQLNPAAQTKIVRVTSGQIFDVAVDIRQGSSTFGKWAGVTLTAENRMQIYVPKGFAHVLLTRAREIHHLERSRYRHRLAAREPDPGGEGLKCPTPL